LNVNSSAIRTTESDPLSTQMKVEITNHFTSDKREYFRWEIYDGPDGIEHARGFASDIVIAFTKIMEWRERIAMDYTQDIDTDINTHEQ